MRVNGTVFTTPNLKLELRNHVGEYADDARVWAVYRLHNCDGNDSLLDPIQHNYFKVKSQSRI